MHLTKSNPCTALLAFFLLQIPSFVSASPPTYTTLTDSTFQLTNGGSLILTISSSGHTTSIKLANKKLANKELINTAAGCYTDSGGKNPLPFPTGGHILSRSNTSIHVVFPSPLADVHYVLQGRLQGWYQWVVNKGLGQQGEVRSLCRFDPALFTHGHTSIKDERLPSLAEIQNATYVQDETFQRADGSYITKYDWSAFVRGQMGWYGVYGREEEAGGGLGAWVVAPGRDYWIGDQLKQEMTVHTESRTGDVVVHVYFHGWFATLLTAGWVFFADGWVKARITTRSSRIPSRQARCGDPGSSTSTTGISVMSRSEQGKKTERGHIPG